MSNHEHLLEHLVIRRWTINDVRWKTTKIVISLFFGGENINNIYIMYYRIHLSRWNVGLGETFNLSYYMIKSDGKSQSYNSKYRISSHVLICWSKLLGQRRWNIGLGETFNLSHRMINLDGKSQSCNSKYAILSHNVLMFVKAFRSKKMKCRAWWDLWFKLSYNQIGC